MEETMICNNCKKEIKQGTKFCVHCGCQIGVTNEVCLTRKRCPKCGATVQTDLKFCTKCGYKVNGKKTGIILTVVIFAVLALGGVTFFYLKGNVFTDKNDIVEIEEAVEAEGNDGQTVDEKVPSEDEVEEAVEAEENDGQTVDEKVPSEDEVEEVYKAFLKGNRAAYISNETIEHITEMDKYIYPSGITEGEYTINDIAGMCREALDGIVIAESPRILYKYVDFNKDKLSELFVSLDFNNEPYYNKWNAYITYSGDRLEIRHCCYDFARYVSVIHEDGRLEMYGSGGGEDQYGDLYILNSDGYYEKLLQWHEAFGCNLSDILYEIFGENIYGIYEPPIRITVCEKGINKYFCLEGEGEYSLDSTDEVTIKRFEEKGFVRCSKVEMEKLLAGARDQSDVIYITDEFVLQ